MTEILSRFVSNPIVSGTLFAMGLAAIGLWLAATWWTYLDASRRTDSEFGRLLAAGFIVVSTPAFVPLSLGVYALVRPQATIGDRRARSLAAALTPALQEALTCQGCGVRTDEEWRRCPECATWLQAPCAQCGLWSHVELDHCPWCGSDVLDLPQVAAPAVSTTLVAAIDVGDRHVGAAPVSAPATEGEYVYVAERETADASASSERETDRPSRASRAARPRRIAAARRTNETPGARRARRSGSSDGAGGRSASRAKP